MYKMSVPLLMLQILLVVLISMGRCTVIFVAAACLSKFSLHITFSSSLLSRWTTPRSKTHRLTLLPHYHLHSSIGRTTDRICPRINTHIYTLEKNTQRLFRSTALVLSFSCSTQRSTYGHMALYSLTRTHGQGHNSFDPISTPLAGCTHARRLALAQLTRPLTHMHMQHSDGPAQSHIFASTNSAHLELVFRPPTCTSSLAISCM
jgi:hypothetical protein